MYYKQLKTPKFEGLESLTGHIENIKNSVIANVKVLDEQTRIRQEQVINEANHLIERITALSQEDENCVRWSEAYDTQRETVVTLKSVPISVSELIRKPLYENKTVIFTSATLALGKDFSYFKNILGVPKDAFELVTSSPFDYKRNALIYISSGQYDQVWEIEELLKASRGRAFVLFTSYQDMRRFHEQVTVPYPKLIQTQDNSRTTLLEEFKNTPNAVLFATKSFWEGVDVRGEQLSQVIIHKLPFSNPSDIIYASKTEKIDNKFGKGAHWKKYTIPEACLNLKQGIGRLIRSKTDKGVISILDSRINYQNYGKTVLNSLPLAYRTQKLENVKKFFEK
jgi:ATP-dependent DNA helicase DinG